MPGRHRRFGRRSLLRGSAHGSQAPFPIAGVFPLSQAEIGTPLEIIEILHSGGVAQRLRPMGMRPGDPIRIVRGAPFWGPIVIEVPGRVLAISRGVARHILVRLASPAAAPHEPSPGNGSADPMDR